MHLRCCVWCVCRAVSDRGESVLRCLSGDGAARQYRHASGSSCLGRAYVRRLFAAWKNIGVIKIEAREAK